MIISKGEKVHVVYRRNFDNEIRRHFIGEIIEVSGAIARLKGNAIIYDNSKNSYVKKPEERITVIDLAGSGYIVNIINTNINIQDLQYIIDNNKKLTLTDNKSFSLDINEFGLNR